MNSAQQSRPPGSVVLALGEVMVRLSPPGVGRLETARSLELHVGGGEYNVVHALSRFGWPAAFVTRLPDHELSRAVLHQARAAGLATPWMTLVPYDGVGRSDRLGLNFTEVGAGNRGGLALFDRGHSAAAAIGPRDFDWPVVVDGARWFHASGIFPVLAPHCADALEAALAAARRAGATVSYDLNYRASLCPPAEAAAINRRMLAHVDVLVGSPEGFEWLLADGTPPVRERPVREVVAEVSARFPGLRLVAGTCRTVHSASCHSLSGFLDREGDWTLDEGWQDLEVVDRVGTGDAFTAGLVHGQLSGWSSDRTLRFALAHAALVHTTRGDTSEFTVGEVEQAASSGGAAMRR